MGHEGINYGFDGLGQPEEGMGFPGEVPEPATSNVEINHVSHVHDIDFSTERALTPEEIELGVGDDGVPNPSQYRPEQRNAA